MKKKTTLSVTFIGLLIGSSVALAQARDGRYSFKGRLTEGDCREHSLVLFPKTLERDCSVTKTTLGGTAYISAVCSARFDGIPARRVIDLSIALPGEGDERKKFLPARVDLVEHRVNEPSVVLRRCVYEGTYEAR